MLVLGDRLHIDFRSLGFAIEIHGLHGDQVDHTAKAAGIRDGTFTDRQLNGNGVSPQSLRNLIEDSFEPSPNAVHLVDKTDAGNMVFVSLPPDGFALSLHPFDGTEDNDTTIENSQASFDFGRKVNVPRCIDDVDRVAIPFA